MLEWMLFRVIMVAFFILASSFFVAAEFALVSVRETRIQQLIALGRPGARTALQLKHSIDEFLPAVQLGVTAAGLALGWIGEPAVADIILHFAEQWLHVLPPHALIYAHTLAVIIAFFLITRPIVKLMNVSAAFVLRLFRAPLRGEGAVHSPEELKLIATATRRMGLLPLFQEEIIHRAIELNHVTVREIMTPRGKIFSLPADMPLQQASARIVEEQHSRIPVYDPATGPEYIIGVVYSKDISRLMHFRSVALSMGGQGESGITLREVMREITVVPETKLAIELLQEFQERRRHIAIVVDEFGSTDGLVTAEDVLEQVVGELEDEFDISRSPLLSTTGAMSLDGSTTLRDLGNQLHWRFPREAGVETLAGFLLAHLGHIPTVGETLEYEGRRYQVAEMAGRRINRVIVEDIAAPQEHVDKANSREATQ